jgi:hypothetical protein
VSVGRIDWSIVPIVFVTIPSCAHCGSLKYDTRRSGDNGDGTRTKLAICRSCGQPFKICAEFPESGNIILPVETI